MSEKQRVAAIEGWFTLDPEAPQLIGSRCTECGTCYFPRQESFCRNPACQSTSFEEAPLSRTGTLWSYTNACYQPPEPFVAPDPFEPFAIAAVQLEEEGMIVLGQVASGYDVDQLKVGMPMQLVVEPLHEEDDQIKMTWKWKPQTAASA